MIKYYNKLVRDNIPDIIGQSGKKANYRVLTGDEYKQALKEKLVEEVNEFLKAETKAEQEVKFGDVKTVLMTIQRDFYYNNAVLIARKKTIQKGEFDKRYFLESVED